MAAATIATTARTHTLGDLNVIIRKYTSLADTNTDTLPAGTNILGVVPILVSAGSPAIQASVASNVITYKVSAGTPDVTVMIIIGV